MSARQALNSYLSDVHRRLRLGALSRGGAILSAAALGATIILVLLARVLLFSAGSVTGAQLTLLCVLALAVCGGIAIPLWRLTRPHAARTAEQRFPQFQQRLVTFTERDTADPFMELLAADTLEVASSAEAGALVTKGKFLAWLVVGVSCAGILVWLIAAAPGFLGYGSHLLWTNSPRGVAPRYDIRVDPGDAMIRRHSDQLVTAWPDGIFERQFFLHAHYEHSSNWERVAMQSRGNSAAYQFMLIGVPENVEYFVEAGARRSPHFNIRIVDPPSIKQIRVTYHFPSWTGLSDRVDELGGDLRALEGTQAELEVITDRPLKAGLLLLDDGRTIALSDGATNHYHGFIAMQRDGAYHVAAFEHGQPVRLSEDYFIEARKPDPPTISIVRPGGDYRASPVEEVTVAVHAADEFGLENLELHYSVNGSPEHTVGLLRRPGVKLAEASSQLALEDFKLVPGDVIGLYATAKDARLESHTDMAFIQIEPFDREFSQSQVSGGGGGGAGNQSGEISQREKEIVATTFKQLNDKSASNQQAAEMAKFLAETQTTLRDQSLMLAGRLRSRELTKENSEFNRFQQEMAAAADAMNPSAEQLRMRKWREAIPEEQKALQHLLRAEATFRQIEVAYAARGGGAGGAGRDLASLFDLELDTEKNQYETQQAASSADQRARDINDALKKLDELAHRQEQLAQRPREQGAAGAEQRWQQEMLQRESQQLQQQLEQLAQSRQQAARQAGAEDAAGSPGPSSASAARQAIQQALDQLRQAQQDMRRAGADGRNAADARLAAERLREATSALGGLQSQEAARRVDSIAREAQRLIAAERDQSERVKRLKDRAADVPQSDRDIARLIGDRQRLADDLARLAQNMRNAARELDSGQRVAADKLRSALKEMDDSDLETLLQRTADWLRTGVDPNSRDTESNIAAGLRRLDEQTHEAQQAINAAGRPPGIEGGEEALDRVARLRQQIEAIGSQPGGRANSGSEVRSNIDVGNNARSGPRSASPAEVASMRDGQKLIQQGLSELLELRKQATNDAEMQRQIRQLIIDMQHLDPRRFPGNPAMVEHIQQQLLSDVDTLELQLRRDLGKQQSDQIRGTDPLAVPRGYEDAVAEYFRRLSREDTGKGRGN